MVLPAGENSDSSGEISGGECELFFSDLHTQERMLADKQRMAFYHEAIERKIKTGDRVIDLGTGTGILAAFCFEARSGTSLCGRPFINHRACQDVGS